MDRDQLYEAQILTSWASNAAPWIDSVRREEIQSRRVTDAAIVDVIKQLGSRAVLDIGCGEGWLARTLAAEGIEVTGLDIVPELVRKARQAGGGTFHVASYEDLVEGWLEIAMPCAVCNFSLLGKESVERLLGVLPSVLDLHGVLAIQTVHPLLVCGERFPYLGGWREETWSGFSRPFNAAAPWYFRTLPEWIDLLRYSGFQLTQIREPLDPVTARPLSLILVASALPRSGRSE